MFAFVIKPKSVCSAPPQPDTHSTKGIFKPNLLITVFPVGSGRSLEGNIYNNMEIKTFCSFTQ